MSAFTTVPARRGFMGSTYNAPPTEPPPPPKSRPTDRFSDAVRGFVQRCFATENAVSSVTTEEMQTRLKKVINEAASAGRLDTTDWSSIPLPQTQILNERTAAKAAPVAKPFVPEDLSDMKLNDGAPSPQANKATSGKKRKSHDALEDSEMTKEGVAAEPWRSKVNPSNVFENRISHAAKSPAPVSRAEKKQRKMNSDASKPDISKSTTDLEKRKRRFGLESRVSISPPPEITRRRSPSPIAMQGPVIGTCQTLEKRYFRLTSAPKPETVRPQHVLEKTLDLLKKKWKTEHNYSYICDQFKSMRQDLTVQHIKNAFTVKVYETHALIALQKQDMGEYNQCQTQLRAFYRQRLGGRPAEFLAYRILYIIYTGNRTDMNEVLAAITPDDRRIPAVKHALDVRSALALGNYHRFFRLYTTAPNMGPYLMDMFISRQRLAAMANISKAYKPEVPVSFLTDELAFENDQECAGFICDHGGEEHLESRAGGAPVFSSGKAGPLFESHRAAAFRKVDLKGQL